MQFSTLAIGCALLLAGATATSQIKLPGGVKVPGIPGLDNIMKKGDAITTSLKDAKFEVPDVNPAGTKQSLTSLQRTPTGGFILQQGDYEATLQSY